MRSAPVKAWNTRSDRPSGLSITQTPVLRWKEEGGWSDGGVWCEWRCVGVSVQGRTGDHRPGQGGRVDGSQGGDTGEEVKGGRCGYDPSGCLG